MRGICKSFPGVQANREVDLTVMPGEIHALLGENGAGKSTLMSILSGLYQPDKGQVILQDRPVAFHSPQEAIAHGVGMIYQHFMLVPQLTVAENVVLGQAGGAFWLKRSHLIAAVDKLIQAYGFDLDPDQRVGTLSLGEQQRVEILRAMYRGSQVLILDEPTAVLTPKEVEELFVILRHMADEGRAVILITHKLKEVLALADRVTVLRKGEVVGSLPREKVDSAQLTQLMIGRDTHTNWKQVNPDPGPPVINVQGLNVLGKRGDLALKNVDLEVRSGEVLAIAGVAGNGQSELMEALAGLRPVLSGQVYLNGQNATGFSVRQRVQLGLRLIPEDRVHVGLVGSLGLAENLVLRDYYLKEYNRGFFLSWGPIHHKAQDVVERFQIQVRDLLNPVGALSGGNLQRLMLARELLREPRALLAAYPTRGLDVGAAENVYLLLDQARQKGTAILAVMEDLDEIMQVADRVAVMYNGRISPTVNTGQVSLDQLGQWMAGIDLENA